jgi:predicted MPP superfamily phosphohydrolase
MRILTASFILILGYFLIGVQLMPPAMGWVALAIPFLSIWLMPALLWNPRRKIRRPRFAELISHGAFFSMGVVSYLLVFSLIKTLAALIYPKSEEIGGLSVLIATVAPMAIGTYRALRGPKIKKVHLEIQNLPRELEGLTIVQISDLHVGPSIRRRYVEGVVSQINSLSADLVMMTGDIGDGNADELRHDVAPLGKIQAKYGRYYVPGNHEYYWNIKKWTERIRGLGMTVLMNKGVVVDVHKKQVFIAGVTDPAAEQLGVGQGPDAGAAAARMSEASFKILLSHRPGLAREAERHGFDLQLSGHTHGGQFFPWTLITPFVHEFHLGLGRAGKMFVYVNSGTGSWGPLLRLGTTPEITYLTLRAA